MTTLKIRIKKKLEREILEYIDTHVLWCLQEEEDDLIDISMHLSEGALNFAFALLNIKSNIDEYIRKNYRKQYISEVMHYVSDWNLIADHETASPLLISIAECMGKPKIVNIKTNPKFIFNNKHKDRWSIKP